MYSLLCEWNFVKIYDFGFHKEYDFQSWLVIVYIDIVELQLFICFYCFMPTKLIEVEKLISPTHQDHSTDSIDATPRIMSLKFHFFFLSLILIMD